MGYIADPEHDRIWQFLFSQVNGYKGQDPESFGLVVDAPLRFTVGYDALLKAEISGKSIATTNAN
jgi:hypothetical protein